MNYDVVILGAGGAGMMCAIHAAQRGRSVILLDHSAKLGGKILISGGGRCNFTNLGASPNNYVSENPHFCKSALSRYSPSDFIALVEKRSIPYHEKKLGQQFCDRSAQEIVYLLKNESEEAGAEIRLNCKIQSIKSLASSKDGTRFSVQTSDGEFTCESLVVATGGLSIPKIGATGFGYDIAKQFGLAIIPTAAALDGFTFNKQDAARFQDLSGLSFDSIITCKEGTKEEISFRENILLTHAGLSGPATLQASLHWRPEELLVIDMLPILKDQKTNLFDYWMQKKKAGNTSLIKNLLSEFLASRLAERLCDLHFPSNLPLPQVSEKELSTFCNLLHKYKIIPAGTVGYSKAEVTRGGVDTNELSSKTMESKKVPGLYFIGEVVDVTGWLGGYNFQWAWASGHAAGISV